MNYDTIYEGTALYELQANSWMILYYNSGIEWASGMMKYRYDAKVF